MATQAECRSMREIMKFTLKKALKILFWITVIVLGVVLFWHVSDITLAFISRQEFITKHWFFVLLLVLSITSIVMGAFLLVCSFVSIEKDLEKESFTFAIFGMIGISLPVILRAILGILSNYIPDDSFPFSLENINDLLNIYSAVLFAGAMLVCAFMKVCSSRYYY